MPCKTLHLLVIIQLALLPSLFSQTSEQLRANLYAFNPDNTVSLYDGNLTLYSTGNSNTVDGMDAVKMTNFGENFGLLRGASTLVIERRQHMTKADTIFFRMWNMHQRDYKIELLLTGLEFDGLTGMLEDKFLNTQTALNLSGVNSTVFTITNNSASWAPDRFRIIFSLPPAYSKLLPITFTGIKATGKNNNIDVEWSVENEKDILQYQIQKSVNGQQFSAVAIIDLKGKTESHYKWTDISSVKGNNFYRIRSSDISGMMQYSNIIKTSIGIESNPVSIYPNPVINGLINVQISDQVKGVYTARLINNRGQVEHVAGILHNGGNSTQTLQVNKNTSKGNYILEIITPDNHKITNKILMQ